MSRLRLLAAGLALSASFALFSGCGDDDDGSTARALDPTELWIVAIQGVEGPRWEPGAEACVEIGADPKQTVAVTIGTKNFTFRPPGACGSLPQCGRAVLRLDPDGDAQGLRVEAAQAVIEASFDGIEPGSHLFRVELIDDKGRPIKSAEAGATLFSQVELDVKTPGGCTGTLPDAGPDADPDASDGGLEDASDGSSDDAADADEAEAEASADSAPEGSADATGE